MQVLVVRKRRSSIPVGSTSCRCRWSSPRPLAMWAPHHAQAEMMGSLVSTTATIVRWIWSLLCLHITTGTIWRYESAKRVKTTLAQLPESGDVALPSLLSPPRRDRHTLPMPHRLSADRAPPPLFSAFSAARPAWTCSDPTPRWDLCAVAIPAGASAASPSLRRSAPRLMASGAVLGWIGVSCGGRGELDGDGS